ncbi:MAG: ROK family protein [Desulfuromonadaceae bacterium]|nr:ROK family protein [Desulfuromonadaceae bacterium]
MNTDSIYNGGSPAIGIDLGGTKTEAVLLATDGTVLWRQRRPTPRAHGYDSMLSIVTGMIRDAAAHVPGDTSYTVGIGIPGSLDASSSLVRNANSTCLIGRPLQADIEQLLGCSVQIRNDANCFTLAECHAGAGRGYGLVFGVIMGTGCGGGICIDGVVREGPHRIAGEWGHLSVAPGGAECYCGNRGCVETLISGSGVEAAFFREHGQRMSMDEIVAQAREGETRCKDAFDRFLDDFGRCLGGVISIIDPDAVVLGGGLSNIDELYAVGTERVKRFAFHDKLQTPILKNQLGDSAGVFGAAWIGQSINKIDQRYLVS